MSNSSKRLVLVTGGTGNQGGATVKHLLETKKVRIRVLTRSLESPKAQRLASLGVELTVGDLDNAASLRRALSGVSAAFSVQNFADKGGVEAEERRGKAFADAVKAADVPFLVYSSAEGVERENDLAHYHSKWAIEQHIAKLGLNRTILRPVGFMDVLAVNSAIRSVMLGLFKTQLGDTGTLQMVAVTDIGWFAARALEYPERFAGRVIPLAGDELTIPQFVAAMKEATGHGQWVAPIPKFVPDRVMPKEYGNMFKWLREQGFKADIPALRKEHPTMLSFADWLKVPSAKWSW
jgi:uncharacterized protein YbjT (DUF2867 family)